MRRILPPLAAGTVLVAAIVLALAGLTGTLPDPDAGSPTPTQAAASRTTADAPSLAEEVPLPDTLRNVTPGGILPLPPITGPLVRVAPKMPEIPTREVPSAVTFRQPLVIDGGTLRADGLTIRLAGLEPARLEDTCPSRLGGDWPCGVRARTALRAFVRRYAVTCDAMEEIAPGVVSATCRRDTTDLAAWMVAQGWMLPADTAPDALKEAATRARTERRGRWQLDGLPRADASLPPLPATGGEDRESGKDIYAPADRSPLQFPEIEIHDTPWHPLNRQQDQNTNPEEEINSEKY